MGPTLPAEVTLPQGFPRSLLISKVAPLLDPRFGVGWKMWLLHSQLSRGRTPMCPLDGGALAFPPLPAVTGPENQSSFPGRSGLCQQMAG